MHHNLTEDQVPATCFPPSILASGSSFGDTAPLIRQVQFSIARSESFLFRLAVSKESGRPHQDDARELVLVKDKRIKVVHDM